MGDRGHLPAVPNPRGGLLDSPVHFGGRPAGMPWVRQCQHQKAWLLDAGTDAEVAFVGGINITQGFDGRSVTTPSPTPGLEVVGDGGSGTPTCMTSTAS